MVGKIVAKMLERGRGKDGRHPCEDHTYPRSYCISPCLGEGMTNWDCGGGVCGRINVNRAPVCPVTPHPIYVAAGTCQCFCLEGVMTLIYMASLMVLVMTLDSLFTMEKLSTMMECPVV